MIEHRLCQFDDMKLRVIHDKVLSGEENKASFDLYHILRIGGHVCMSRVGGWIRLIFEESII